MRQRLLSLGPVSVAALAFLAANVLHAIDHQRQGTERLTTEVMAGGTVLTALAILTAALALRRNSRAPLVAAAVGFYAAAGVTAAHIAPHWSAFSDPYPEIGADAVSWVVMLLEVGTAFALGVVGLRELRRAAHYRERLAAR